MNVVGQFLLFLQSHGLRLVEFSRQRWLFLLLLGLAGLQGRFDGGFVDMWWFYFARNAVVVLFQLVGDLDEVLVGSIEEVTVVEDLHHIGVELSGRLVLAALQLGLDSCQVHRLLHYLQVLRNVEAFHVHWLHERKRAFVLLEHLQGLETGLHQLVYGVLANHCFFRRYLRLLVDVCRGLWFEVGLDGCSQQQLFGGFLLGLRLAVLLAVIDVEGEALRQQSSERLHLLCRQLHPEDLARRVLGWERGGFLVFLHNTLKSISIFINRPPLLSLPHQSLHLKHSRTLSQVLQNAQKCKHWVRLRAIYYRYQFKIMIFNRNKQSKTETPTRSIQQLGKITPLLVGTKKSDPFLKELKEVYDKQNIHPNLRENRTKSYHNKTDAQDNRSPIKKVMNLKQIHKNNNAPTRKENEGLNSHSKYSQSSELQRMPVKSRSSNRKSTEKDEQQFHFQDQYYPSKEEKKEKKMKVTLKDIKRQRKSVQETDGEYTGKPNGDTRETISQDSLNKDSNNVQMTKNQHAQQQITVHSFEPAQSSQPKHMKADLCCWNHPEKKATHQLQAQDQAYCQKCAVNLAINGCRLIPIQQGRQRLQRLQEERLGEIKDFLFELDKMEPIFKRTMRRIQNYRYFLGSKLEEEGKKLDIYYGNLCTVIKNSYETAKTTLKLHYDAIIEEIDNNAFIVNAHGEEIASLKQDILPNIDQIIQESRVCSDIFTTKIHYNYARLEEAERAVREIEAYNCNYYQFRFENVEHLLVQLRTLISPSLQPAYFDSSFQTQRKNTQQSQEKRFDPFRMSFGKNNGSAHRF